MWSFYVRKGCGKVSTTSKSSVPTPLTAIPTAVPTAPLHLHCCDVMFYSFSALRHWWPGGRTQSWTGEKPACSRIAPLLIFKNVADSTQNFQLLVRPPPACFFFILPSTSWETLRVCYDASKFSCFSFVLLKQAGISVLYSILKE